MIRNIAVLLAAAFVTTACVYDRGIYRPAPVEHREHRSDDRQYEPVRQPARESQRERNDTQRRDSGEQRRDDRQESDHRREQHD